MLPTASPFGEPLICLARIDETAEATTFELAPAIPRTFDYRPGQFIVLTVDIDGKPHQRAYSLSSSPTRPQRLAVTVKRVKGGRVSNWLIDYFQPDHQLHALAPSGQFHLPDAPRAERLVLASAGSGITPMMSMLRYLVDRQESVEVHFVHCARSPEEVIFREELEHLAATHTSLHVHWHFSATQGRIDAARLQATLPRLENAEAYLCGPDAFMDQLSAWLGAIGLPATHLHRERFGAPATSATGNARYQLRVPQFDRAFSLAANETLLDALEREQLPILGACRSGVCGACKCKVESGSVESGGDPSLVTAEEAAEGVVLACSTRATSDLVVSW